jgi:hypothetical protein
VAARAAVADARPAAWPAARGRRTRRRVRRRSRGTAPCPRSPRLRTALRQSARAPTLTRLACVSTLPRGDSH